MGGFEQSHFFLRDRSQYDQDHQPRQGIKQDIRPSQTAAGIRYIFYNAVHHITGTKKLLCGDIADDHIHVLRTAADDTNFTATRTVNNDRCDIKIITQ